MYHIFLYIHPNNADIFAMGAIFNTRKQNIFANQKPALNLDLQKNSMPYPMLGHSSIKYGIITKVEFSAYRIIIACNDKMRLSMTYDETLKSMGLMLNKTNLMKVSD